MYAPGVGACDVGGPLSHSSVLAREYGIPAVLGTGAATVRLRDGQRIVHGRRGWSPHPGRPMITIGQMEDHPHDAHGPLYLLAGAPGAGKTTLLPYLLRAADGLVVMDMDELLEDGELIGVPIAEPEAAPVWPAYDRLWRRIVTMVRRVGHPVLLMCPIPDAAEVPPGVRWDEPVHWALLDCPDDERARRLRERGAPQEWIDDALADAAQGRELIPAVFHAVGADHAGLAGQVLAWARGRTESG
ncbi:PEP-utilizing enzyme [Streptosporangium roseum]|uniref:PEP-utilizing enzyme n=1 Tax=Streptosporangium roseum TaxID=2001 RepID=UPI00332CBCCD